MNSFTEVKDFPKSLVAIRKLKESVMRRTYRLYLVYPIFMRKTTNPRICFSAERS
ncbi:unnamed protein product [Oppiella nova]|uniref:Uncharacterized protein n=1 Tax=Oppiella nova TaxID=334625 RepID=A0A7R9MTI1_9ACAR|nr:unnamed protein product [Oppiella nova]CAG2183016.1 unnamed protein product [Oppiella nova]